MALPVRAACTTRVAPAGSVPVVVPTRVLRLRTNLPASRRGAAGNPWLLSGSAGGDADAVPGTGAPGSPGGTRVTARLGADDAPVPAAFVAVTVNV